jgi:hypothetical protein
VFVDVDEMRTGANTSHNASWLAMEGKQKLSRANVNSGIFGDFASADNFHSGISGAHTQHVARLRGHEARLGGLGDKAHVAASSFVDMEKRNNQALEAVLWSHTRT